MLAILIVAVLALIAYLLSKCDDLLLLISSDGTTLCLLADILSVMRILFQVHSQSCRLAEGAFHGDQVFTSLQLSLIATIYLDVLYEGHEAVLDQVGLKIEFLQESLC